MTVKTLHSARPVAYCARVSRATNQAVGYNAASACVFTAVEYDFPGGMWASGAPSRLTAPVQGIYYAAACLTVQTSQSGIRQIYFRKNGNNYPAQVNNSAPSSSNQFIFCLNADFYMAQGDYLELILYHSATSNGVGINLNMEGASYKITMSLRLVSPSVFKDWG